MSKLELMRLWDLYGGLFTRTQREIADMYFNLDLTLSEIAAEKGISRQGVSECIKVCKKQLEEYEKALGIADRLARISAAIEKAAGGDGGMEEALKLAQGG